MAQERQILGYKPDGTPIEGPPLSAPPTTMTVGEPFKANLESLGGPAQPRYKDPLDADRRDQFNAEAPEQSSFSILDFFKSLLDSPGKAVQLGQDALKAKLDHDLGVVDKVASGAQSVYQFGKDVVTDAADISLPKAGQALSNFASGVTGDESVPFGESGPLSRLASGAGFVAGMMIPGEAEIAGARKVGKIARRIRPAVEDVLDVAKGYSKYGIPGKREIVPIGKLRGGVRSTSESDMARVSNLAKEIDGPDGYIARLIVDQDDNVIEGQHRLEALRQLKDQTVPIHRIVDLSSGYDVDAMEAAAKEAGLRSDNVQQMVQNALETLQETGGDIQKALTEYEMPAHLQGPFAKVLSASRRARGLYSRLDDAFKLIPDKPLHPNAVLNLLKKAPGGVSTEEMAYRGVPEFLAGYGEKPVPRAALAAHLEANPAPMPTVKTLGGMEPASSEMQQAALLSMGRQPTTVDEWMELSSLLEQQATGAIKPRANTGVHFRRGEYAETLTPKQQRERWFTLSEEATRRAEALSLGRGEYAGEAKYGRYQVPGGENYRETLLTLPHKAPEGVPDGFTVKQSSNGQWGVFGPGPMEENRYGSGATREAALEKFRSYGHTGKPDYRSPHFPDDPNLLLHTRANDRTLPKLGRGRFLEEAQSDLHQAGKKKGYGVRPNDVAIEQWLRDAGGPVKHQGDKWFFKALGEYKEAVGATSMDEARSAQRNFAIKSLDGIAQTGVPDAPFKDSWPELGLKQQLLEVAEDPDANWIGFTSGKTQADRYDLSKQVSALHYKKNADGTFNVSVQAQGRGQMLGEALTDKQLSDHVGKEVAEKIIRGEGKERNLAANSRPADMHRELSGLDLQVGGEGMTEFYDKKLPARMNKIVKPFGGVVERIKMGDGFAWIVKLTPEMKKKILASGLSLMTGVAMVDSRKDNK
jgi:hypothetical protein